MVLIKIILMNNLSKYPLFKPNGPNQAKALIL